MDKWIEERSNDCTYELKCPNCAYRYSPNSSVDGTISSSEIYRFCPKCGNQLDDPSPDKRW